MEWTFIWLVLLTCTNISLLGLVVYAILRPNAIRDEVRDLIGGYTALSSIVARLDGQLSVIFGDDPAKDEPTVSKAKPTTTATASKAKPAGASATVKKSVPATKGKLQPKATAAKKSPFRKATPKTKAKTTNNKAPNSRTDGKALEA